MFGGAQASSFLHPYAFPPEVQPPRRIAPTRRLPRAMAAVLLGVVKGQTARETARRHNMDVRIVEKRVKQLRVTLGAGNASSFLHAALDLGYLKVVGPKPQGHPHLSPRQWEVLRLLDQGKENDEIAEELGIREATVRSHLRVIAEALHARRRTEIVAAAYCWGMLK